jgi:MFS family permease
MTPQAVQRIYLTLILGNTLAASLIWGINTIFLLDAGLTNFEAFAANAVFTAGMVLFEIPTGIIADTWGRRASYLLGTITLALSTLLYVLLWQLHAPFWQWAVVSLLLGLGFTFFSGAVEAWLVDALHATGYTDSLEKVFGRGQIASGVAMLTGSVGGGVIAQATNLGVPFVLRGVILIIMFIVAALLMRDIGFTPSRSKHPLKDMRNILNASITHGLGNRPVRWVMLSAPFASGVGFYAFYALQPYILRLYGNEQAFAIAGLVAAAVAGAQIAGGISAPYVRKLVRKRTSALMLGTVLSASLLILVGRSNVFAVVLLLIVLWGLVFAAVTPIRQAYLNSLIPSKQRATVLSFDSLMGSSGGVVIQPALGRTADVWSYGTSFVVAGIISLLSLPFLALARQEETAADKK